MGFWPPAGRTSKKAADAAFLLCCVCDVLNMVTVFGVPASLAALRCAMQRQSLNTPTEREACARRVDGRVLLPMSE